MTTEASRGHRTVFDKILDAISAVNMFISGVLLVILTAIFGWLVFGRYVLNATPTWVEQLALILVVYIGFLGASVGIHRNTHLGVAVVREMCPRPVQRAFSFLSNVLLVGFGLIMAFYGYKLSVFKWDTPVPLLPICEWVRSLPVLLCGVFVFLYSVNHLIHFFKNCRQASDK